MAFRQILMTNPAARNEELRIGRANLRLGGHGQSEPLSIDPISIGGALMSSASLPQLRLSVTLRHLKAACSDSMYTTRAHVASLVTTLNYQAVEPIYCHVAFDEERGSEASQARHRLGIRCADDQTGRMEIRS